MRRDPAGRFGQAHRIKLSAAVREHLRQHPTATLAELCKATGASNAFASELRARVLRQRAEAEQEAEAERREYLERAGEVPMGDGA